MSKEYTSLGLMSGTSMDGVDASIVQSDGEKNINIILDEYFEYPQEIYKNLVNLRSKINNDEDMKNFSSELLELEREITLFHAKSVKQILNQKNLNIDLIGFHGQTIYHESNKKISKQLGDGQLLSQLLKKNIVFNFRINDLLNGGEGAPLTPIYHKALAQKLNLKPVSFINLGGIINFTTITENGEIFAKDLGPGMCMIDNWIRNNSQKKYDYDGKTASSGITNELILNQYLENFYHFNKTKRSFDTSDFDISFARGLSLKEGAATITSITAEIINSYFFSNTKSNNKHKIILCGGGRKNNFLFEKIKKIKTDVKKIDNYGINGDFVESQAFAFLAIRSFLNLPISFPETTGCKEPTIGGKLIEFK
tara:strand:+ start:27515 stop:28615 length:1101 start_codon:yes stop_codon:yes gene_type:complete